MTIAQELKGHAKRITVLADLAQHLDHPALYDYTEKTRRYLVRALNERIKKLELLRHAIAGKSQPEK